MTATGELQRQLEATFATEAQERLRNIERDLLALESAGSAAGRETMESLTRNAHSLKGAAQVIGLREVSLVAHALESRLAAMARTPEPAETPLQPLFEAVTAIGRLLDPRTARTVDVPALVAALGEEVEAPDVVRRRPAPRQATPARPSRRRPIPAEPGLWHPDAGERPASLPRTPGAAVPESPARGATESAPVSVRVRTARLDTLLARGGDMLAVRDRAAALHGELRELHGDVVRWRREWQRTHGALDAVAHHDLRPLDEVVSFADATGAHLQRLERGLSRVRAAAAADRDRVTALAAGVTADTLELRLVPVAMLFDEFPVMVRELARAAGKQVRLQEDGWTTEIDRQILERLKDPVMHLLRNAVDHGIEAERERVAAGKDPVGLVVLKAGQSGDGICVEVRDDGRGIDRARVRAAALRAGVPESEIPPSSDAAGIATLVLRHGVSTADSVTEMSGRGVGLDVVAETVARLGGTVSVDSEVGLGTRVSLRLPLTLMMANVLLVRAHSRRYALPIGAIERCMRLRVEDMTEIAGRQTVLLPDGPVGLVDLATITGDAPGAGGDPCRVAVIVRAADATVGFLVAEVLADHQVLARGLGEFAVRAGGVPLVAGAALLGADDLVLVLDPAQLVRVALAADRGAAAIGPAVQIAARAGPVSVLVVDDSLTTRTLEKSILEAAGFSVGVAADGLAALAEMRRERYDLIVADVDMPRIDGLELTRRLKAEPATRDVPVVLVTALESPEQQEQGLLAGADAYMLKSAFDQRTLLETIRSLVG